jgi:hypothetical protein
LLTFFTAPKPFSGHIGIIQRNAIKSWMLLRPQPEIILFGPAEGAAEIAGEFGLRHIRGVACSEFGTPLVSDIFTKAQADRGAELFCFVNCDIILFQDFIDSIDRTRNFAKRFLMVGQCWNTDITGPVDFQDPNWEERFRVVLKTTAKQREITGIDYFVFSRDLFAGMPPFSVGRPFFDNWLVWRACHSDAAVVDATATALVVHQNHPPKWVWTGNDAVRNFQLAGGWHTRYSIANAGYRLTPDGIVRDRIRPFCAQWKLRRWIWTSSVINWTRPARHALGFNQQRFDALKRALFRR